MNADDSKVPRSAGWLGGLGAIPFVGLAGALPFLGGAPQLFAAHALAAYGAVILSFLGGIHWGLAIACRDRAIGGRLLLSVMPSLAGWAALLLPERPGLGLLAASVAAMLGVDIRATNQSWTPRWYPKLRIPLTCVVVCALVVGAIAV
jgi:hypothetical protein